MTGATGDTLQQHLDDVVTMACQVVTGCDAATIRVVGSTGASTACTTHEACLLDRVQEAVGEGPCLQALHDDVVVRVVDFESDRRWPAVARAAAGAGFRSSLSVPLRYGDRPLGSLSLYARRARAFDEDSERTGVVLARHAARAVVDTDPLRRGDDGGVVQRRISRTLQRELSPVVQDRPGLTCEARYSPAEHGAEVGGDWYDVFALQGGATGVAIGDVMGHDIAAAAQMGQLRSILRSYAYEGGSPSEVLDRSDRLVQAFETGLATVLYGTLQLEGAGACLTYSNAGHLPPLVRYADGAVRTLTDGSSWLVGLPPTHLGRRTGAAVRLPSGSSLVLYTDGLVERRRHHLDEGIGRLAAALSGPLPDDHPRALCDRVLERLQPDDGCTDDMALLVLRVD